MNKKIGLPEAAEGRFFDGLLKTSAEAGETLAEERRNGRNLVTDSEEAEQETGRRN